MINYSKEREGTTHVCVCVCACVRACVRVCAHTCLCIAGMYVCVCADASGVLFTQEVSLGNLLDPVWVGPHQESCLKLQLEEQPAQSPEGAGVVVAPRASRCAERFLGENYSFPLAQSPSVSNHRQLLVENHTPITVIENYTPCCLDNHEYFVGKIITTLTPQGYRVGGEGEGSVCSVFNVLGVYTCVQVSIIQYTKPSDRKRLINDRFRELFPHIGLPLTSLRR